MSEPSSSMIQIVREKLWRDESEHRVVLAQIGKLSDLSAKLQKSIAGHRAWLEAHAKKEVDPGPASE